MQQEYSLGRFEALELPGEYEDVVYRVIFAQETVFIAQTYDEALSVASKLNAIIGVE